MLKCYDSSTAVTGYGDVLVTVPGHCQALTYDQVTASKDLPNVENSLLAACQCSHWLS